MRILLVEDTELDREVVLRAASGEFTVDECTTLAAAKKLVNGHDAVACDLHLNDGTDPVEVMDWLATLESPRVVYTITDDLRLARELGRRHLQFIRKSNLTVDDLLFTLHWAAGAHDDFAEKDRRKRKALGEIRRQVEEAIDECG